MIAWVELPHGIEESKDFWEKVAGFGESHRQLEAVARAGDNN